MKRLDGIIARCVEAFRPDGVTEQLVS
jgi:hypothetical protein